MKNKDLDNNLQTLRNLLFSLNNKKDQLAILEDLFTPAEAKDLVERWKAVSLLLRGKTQREVKDRLNISISKVSHAARILQYGSGGFQKAWTRVKPD